MLDLRHRLWSASLFLLALGASGPAFAQEVEDFWPEVAEEEQADCDAMPGIGLFRYDNSDRDGRWKRYVLTTTCYAPEANRYVGAEVLEGFTKIQPAPGFFGRYEILSDGERRMDRRSFSIAPIIDEMSMEEEEEPAGDPSVFYVTGMIPSGTVTKYPGLTRASVSGYSYLAPRDDLQALPEGLWQFHGGADYDHRLTVRQPVEPDNLNLGGWIFLVAIGPEGQSIYAPADFASDPSLSLDVADGEVSGTFGFKVANPVNLEARNPEAWDTAEIQINRLLGRLVENAGEVIVVALGTGRVVLRDEEGQTAVENATAQFVGRRAPPELTDAILTQFFPDFPGR